MSRSSTPGGRSLFASKISYDALEVESANEASEEEVEETQLDSSSPSEPSKPSKSALKKAAAAARKERRLQEKAAAKAARAAGTASPVSPMTPQAAESSPLFPGSVSTTKPAITLDMLTAVPAPSQGKSAQESFAEKVPVQTSTTAVPKANGIFLENGHLSSEPQSEPQPALNGESTPSKDSMLAFRAGEVTSLQPNTVVPKVPSSPPVGGQDQKVVTESAALPPAQEEDKKKRQNVLERVIWTFIMIGGFITLLLLGHPYMIILVMLCQTLVYREVTALFSLKSAESKDTNKPDLKGKDPWSKTLNWYFFAVTNYFLYGESIIYYFKHVVFADAQLLPFATNHRMISFMLYIIGFMGFVMSLKRGYLKQQFGLFCWVHMSLLIIVFSSHFIVNNILEGLIWFWVPASLVICNDCFAYIWGKLFGRTPLIALSPKKTVEGFVGAFWSTLIFGVIWGTLFMRWDYMICPVRDLGANAFASISCKPNPVFVWKTIELWRPVASVLSTMIGKPITTMSYAPYQLHLLTLSGFASLVAPFGGFFASGFKRAFNIKDFGHSIPGHGGMTDRMDCQFLMGVFTYVYYTSLIRQSHVTVGGVLQTIVSGLDVNQQLELIADLTRYLEKQGITVPR